MRTPARKSFWKKFTPGSLPPLVMVSTVLLLAPPSRAQETPPAVKSSGADVGLPPGPPSEKAASAPQDSPGESSSKAQSPKPASPAGGPASDLPVPFPAARYSGLLEKSLFALATAPVEIPAPVDNFATNWFLSSFSKSRSKDGAEVYTVFVKSRDLSTRLMLVGEKPDDGVTLVAVEEAPNRAETVAVIKKGTEIGRVKFDQAAFAAAPPPPMPAQPRPGALGAAVRPGTPPTGAAPAPPGKIPSPSAVKTSIPRPGMSAQPRSSSSVTPVPGAVPPPPASSSSQDSRRRIRPIDAAPANP